MTLTLGAGAIFAAGCVAGIIVGIVMVAVIAAWGLFHV